MNAPGISVDRACRGESRVAGEVRAVACKSAAAHIYPRIVRAESSCIIFGGVVVKHAPVEHNRRGIDPDRAPTGNRWIRDIVLERARDKTGLDMRDAHCAGVEFFSRESVREP